MVYRKRREKRTWWPPSDLFRVSSRGEQRRRRGIEIDRQRQAARQAEQADGGIEEGDVRFAFC